MEDMQQIKSILPDLMRGGLVPPDVLMEVLTSKSLSSMKYKEEVFAYYSMYRAVKEQHQYLMEKAGIELKRNTE